MLVTEKGRKKLATLIVIQEDSHRNLAKAVGWKSHSYVGRILRGEVRSVTPEAAARIAAHFGIPMDDIFVPRVSGDGRRAVQTKATDAA